MKFAVGVDIENIQRFEKMAKGDDKASLKTIYTPSEIKYSFSKARPAQHLAVRFCGKEAVIKALRGLGIKTYYRNVEITNDGNSVPKVKLLGIKTRKKIKITISLSHSKDRAIAFAVAICEK